MDFREFATNYLNPIFLMYRAVLFIVSFFILFLSIPIFTASASRNEVMVILGIAVALSIGLYIAFRHRAYLLYAVIPIFLVTISVWIRGEDVVRDGVMILPMAMCWSSAFLLAFNGLRSWGYGISAKEIGNKIQNKLDTLN